MIAQSRLKVGKGINVGVDVEVAVAVAGAFQQNFALLPHVLGSVDVGETVGVAVGWGFKQGPTIEQLSKGGDVLVGAGVSNMLCGLYGVTLAALPGSSGSHSTPYTGPAKTKATTVITVTMHTTIPTGPGQ